MGSELRANITDLKGMTRRASCKPGSARIFWKISASQADLGRRLAHEPSSVGWAWLESCSAIKALRTQFDSAISTQLGELSLAWLILARLGSASSVRVGELSELSIVSTARRPRLDELSLANSARRSQRSKLGELDELGELSKLGELGKLGSALRARRA